MTTFKEPVALSWSGGKDSAMAAHHLLTSERYDITSLVTTVTEGHDRISMHGVRRELLERQAAALAIPLRTVVIPKTCSNEDYESRMSDALHALRRDGVTKMAFGDLFLADIKRYRDDLLTRAGMSGLYPLWMHDTTALVRSFVELGFRGWLCCVDTQAIDAAFAGRALDLQLLRDLPPGADPAGENGEYHTFVYDGPIFGSAIACRTGAREMRLSRFNYCDIVPE